MQNTPRHLSPSFSNTQLTPVGPTITDNGLNDAVIRNTELVQKNELLKFKCSNQRRELRRLNQQMYKLRALEAENVLLKMTIDILHDEDLPDTDPAPADPEQDSQVTVLPPPSPRSLQESYDDWDMRTRFSSGGPRHE